VTASAPKSSTEIDRHVGARMRSLRLRRSMSQTELAGQLGVTFQQVQKYERGVNRISAARLFAVARVLDVDITYFFAGLRSWMVE
jgi:transcriptional regulator with XRE-family HTH domain